MIAGLIQLDDLLLCLSRSAITAKTYQPIRAAATASGDDARQAPPSDRGRRHKLDSFGESTTSNQTHPRPGQTCLRPSLSLAAIMALTELIRRADCWPESTVLRSTWSPSPTVRGHPQRLADRTRVADHAAGGAELQQRQLGLRGPTCHRRRPWGWEPHFLREARATERSWDRRHDLTAAAVHAVTVAECA